MASVIEVLMTASSSPGDFGHLCSMILAMMNMQDSRTMSRNKGKQATANLATELVRLMPTKNDLMVVKCIFEKHPDQEYNLVRIVNHLKYYYP